MAKKIKLLFFPISIFIVTFGGILGFNANAAGTNGADIYCLMRDGGIEHEPSWQAAYQAIKNKKPGVFKTSPKQAAAMIIEEVVQEPDKYSDCITYLGDLFPTGETYNTPITESSSSETTSENKEIVNTEEIEPATKPSKGEFIDRYSY